MEKDDESIKKSKAKASGYDWNVPCSYKYMKENNAFMDKERKFISAYEELRNAEKPENILKEIIFNLQLIDRNALEKMCRVLHIENSIVLMESALIKDTKNGYVDSKILNFYVSHFGLESSSERELIYESDNDPVMFGILETYIEQADHDFNDLSYLLTSSAKRPELQDLLKSYFKKCGVKINVPFVEMIEESVNNPGIRDVLKFCIVECGASFYSVFDVHGKSSSLKKLVDVAYGNREMTSILDLYKLKNPEGIFDILQIQKNTKQKKHKEILMRKIQRHK